MGSVEEIMMGSRWAALAALLALAEATKWSNIGFMSSQDQAPANKRNAEDGHELSLDDMELSASETQYDAVPYTDLGLSSGEAESRVEPFRRRKYRRRRRKNRYENLVVPGQDYSEDTLSDNKLYDRDSSYKAPSANYAAPESSYEAPSYSSYEAPKYEPNYTPSYEGYSGGRAGYSYRGFGPTNSVSKSDSLGLANNLYEYDYYGENDDTHGQLEDNLLVKLIKYLGG